MKFKHLTKEIVLHAADLIADDKEAFMCCAVSQAAKLPDELYRVDHPARLELQKILYENGIQTNGGLQDGLGYITTEAQRREYRILFLLFVAEAYFGE